MRHTLLVLIAMICTTSCRRDPGDTNPVSNQWTAMGTLASLSVPHDQQSSLEGLTAQAQSTMDALERELSTWRQNSAASALNRAGGEPVETSPILREVLTLSLRYAECSQGSFDPTVGPLMQLWGFRNGQPPTALPDPARVEAAMTRVSYQHVLITPDTAQLTRPGMRIDFGGIGKGYAVDVCFDELTRQGVTDLMVNLGGNMRCGGKANPHRPWRVGVRHPLARDALLGMLELSNGMALATSGNYEKFITIDGRRYAHIMDPRTGRPVEGMAGVTVLSPSAAEADAMSTALFVAGLERARKILACAPRAEALLVPDQNPMVIYVTDGFRRRFAPLPEFADILRDLP